MIGSLKIFCPAMPVVSTNPWSPFAGREAQELACKGNLTLGLMFHQFSITFPKTPVRKNWNEELTLPDGTVVNPAWIVDECMAVGEFGGEGTIRIKYGREAILRRGRLMVAQPVDGVGELMLPDGRTATIKSRLPHATGRPTGFGWWRDYLVDAVEVPGTAEFSS